MLIGIISFVHYKTRSPAPSSAFLSYFFVTWEKIKATNTYIAATRGSKTCTS